MRYIQYLGRQTIKTREYRRAPNFCLKILRCSLKKHSFLKCSTIVVTLVIPSDTCAKAKTIKLRLLISVSLGSQDKNDRTITNNLQFVCHFR